MATIEYTTKRYRSTFRYGDKKVYAIFESKKEYDTIFKYLNKMMDDEKYNKTFDTIHEISIWFHDQWNYTRSIKIVMILMKLKQLPNKNRYIKGLQTIREICIERDIIEAKDILRKNKIASKFLKEQINNIKQSYLAEYLKEDIQDAEKELYIYRWRTRIIEKKYNKNV